MLVELHIAPSQFEEEDYYRLNEVLSAQGQEDRVKTGSDFMAEMGINPDTTDTTSQSV